MCFCTKDENRKLGGGKAYNGMDMAVPSDYKKRPNYGYDESEMHAFHSEFVSYTKIVVFFLALCARSFCVDFRT